MAAELRRRVLLALAWPLLFGGLLLLGAGLVLGAEATQGRS